MHFPNSSGDSGVVPFFEEAYAFGSVALVHHLSLNLVVLAGALELAALPYIVHERLLDAYVLAALHRVERNFKVRMVGSGHADGVDILAHFIEHFAVVLEKSRFRVFLFVPAAHSGVDVAESDRVFALHAVYSHSADSPYAYKRDVKLAVGRFCRGYRESRQYERRRSSGSDILYEFSSIHFFPFFMYNMRIPKKREIPPPLRH